MKFVFAAVLLIIVVFTLVLAAPPQHPLFPQNTGRSQHPRECVREAMKIKDLAGRKEALDRCRTQMGRRPAPHLGPRHPAERPVSHLGPRHPAERRP